MNTGLTKREKVLIIIAASILVIFVSFKFVFQPVYNKYYATTEKNSQLDTDKQLMEIKLMNEAAIEAGFKRAQIAHAESQKYFPEVMTNEELDRLITGLCLKNNVKPTLLGMSVIKRELPVSSEVVSSAPTLDEDALNAKAAENQSDAQSSSEPEPISVFTIATAMVNASGTYEELQKIITEVNATTHIRINSLTYVYTKVPEAGDGEKPPEITIVFEVTMVDGGKLEYAL